MSAAALDIMHKFLIGVLLGFFGGWVLFGMWAFSMALSFPAYGAEYRAGAVDLPIRARLLPNCADRKTAVHYCENEGLCCGHIAPGGDYDVPPVIEGEAPDGGAWVAVNEGDEVFE